MRGSLFRSRAWFYFLKFGPEFSARLQRSTTRLWHSNILQSTTNEIHVLCLTSVLARFVNPIFLFSESQASFWLARSTVHANWRLVNLDLSLRFCQNWSAQNPRERFELKSERNVFGASAGGHDFNEWPASDSSGPLTDQQAPAAAHPCVPNYKVRTQP